MRFGRVRGNGCKPRGTDFEKARESPLKLRYSREVVSNPSHLFAMQDAIPSLDELLAELGPHMCLPKDLDELAELLELDELFAHLDAWRSDPRPHEVPGTPIRKA